MLTAAIRPAGIHGEKDTTVTHKILEHGQAASDLVLRMQLGENENLFDFTYVGNIAYAHLLAGHRLLASHEHLSAGKGGPLDYERVDGEAFNITNDQPVYFWDVTRAMWALIDRVVEPEQVWALPEGLLGTVGGVAETVMGFFGKTPRLTARTVRYSCMTRYYSTEKAKHRLAYSPVVPLDEGIARAVGFIVAQQKSDAAKKSL
jgi:sterol-4alpha-carboxylate 3-dehydrogenase (decarboxylating)